MVAVLLVVNATFASSSPSGCIRGIAKEFNISLEVAGLVVTLFLLGYCFGPLFWAPLSEFYGRRWIFYISFTLYLAFNFLCAFAKNLPALLIGRFLTGTFASSPLSNSAGVLADIWGPVERGNAMAVFAVMTFAGPALGPVISGFLELKENWRWNFYVLLWLGGVSALLLFTLPETLPQVVLLNKARRIRRLKVPGQEDVKAPLEATDRKLSSIFRVALTRPWKIMIDPISFLIAIYLSIVYMLLYMLFSIYPIVFQEKRGWNSGVGQLPLIGTIIGAVAGGLIIFFYSSHRQKRMKPGQKELPEDRLPIAMVGGILFPIAMFWFAWSGEYNSVHWMVPTLAGTFLSTSILLVFVSYFNYLADTYLMYAASAIAANTVARSACGAAAPLFTSYMFTALGVGGGGSLVGGVAVLLSPIPFIFYRYGEGIRRRSKFAPTPDVDAKAPGEQQNETLSSKSTEVGATSDSNGHLDNGDIKKYVALKPGASSRQDNDRESLTEQDREQRISPDIDVEKGEKQDLQYTT